MVCLIATPPQLVRETTQVTKKIRKILDVKDVIAFVRLLMALRFRAFRLCCTAIILASIDVLSIVLLAAFVSSILLTDRSRVYLVS